MRQVKSRIAYDTRRATLLADDEYTDGSNLQYDGRNRYLYRSPHGRYFLHTHTLWRGEHDGITPLTPEEAEETYEGLAHQILDFEDAFPHATVEEA